MWSRFGFPHHEPVDNSVSSPSFYIPRPSHLLSHYQTKGTKQEILILQFLSPSCNLNPLEIKFVPM